MDPTIRATVNSDLNVLGTRIKVMTYNVLAQSMVNRNQFPTNGKAVKYTYRFSALITEFRNYNPDVLCMQEVDNGKFQQRLKTELQKLGYDSLYRTHPSKAHGLMIAWKKDQWFLKTSRLLALDDQKSFAQQVRSSNIALFVLLGSRTSPESDSSSSSSVGQLWVGTTHLYWHPDADYERARQMLLIRDTARELAANKEARVVIAGDFNSTPDSAAYALATGQTLTVDQKQALDQSASTPEFRLLIVPNGRNEPPPIPTQLEDGQREVDALVSEAESPNDLPQLKSCYALGSHMLRPETVKDHEPVFTNWTEWFKATIDYIFVLDTPDLKVTGLLETPSESAMGPEPNSLPRDSDTCKYPSDHIAVMAEITFTTHENNAQPSWGSYISGLGAKIMQWVKIR